MCCWGKLQTSLSSIPGPLYHRSPSLSSSPEDFRSPFSRGTLLLPTQFRSSQHPEAKEDDPPLTSSSRSGNQNKPGRGGGNTSQVNILGTAPTPAVRVSGSSLLAPWTLPKTPSTWGGGRGTGTIGKKTMPDPVLEDQAGGGAHAALRFRWVGEGHAPQEGSGGRGRGHPVRAPPPGSRSPPPAAPPLRLTLVDGHAARVPIAVDQRVFGPAPLVRTYAAASYHLLHTPMSSLRGWGWGPAGGGRGSGGEGGSGGRAPPRPLLRRRRRFFSLPPPSSSSASSSSLALSGRPPRRALALMPRRAPPLNNETRAPRSSSAPFAGYQGRPATAQPGPGGGGAEWHIAGARPPRAARSRAAPPAPLPGRGSHGRAPPLARSRPARRRVKS